MRSLKLTKDALNFVKGLEQPKHFKQVVSKILSLLADPLPVDSKELKGYSDFLRADSGQYRIVYQYSDTDVLILLVDKRNDDQVYKKLERKK